MHTPSPSKKASGSSKSTEKRSDVNKNVPKSPVGSKNLPITRIRHIMEYSPGGDNLKISEDAVRAMARAAEGFIEMLAQGAYQEAPGVKVDYNHLSAFVHSNDEFDFIQDILPRKERFSEIMKLMKKNKSTHI